MTERKDGTYTVVRSDKENGKIIKTKIFKLIQYKSLVRQNKLLYGKIHMFGQRMKYMLQIKNLIKKRK